MFRQSHVSCGMYPLILSSTLLLSLNLCVKHSFLFNLLKSDLKTWSQTSFKKSAQHVTPDKAELREAAPRFHWRGPEFAPTFPRTLLPAADFNVTCYQKVFTHVSSVSCSAEANFSVNMWPNKERFEMKQSSLGRSVHSKRSACHAPATFPRLGLRLRGLFNQCGQYQCLKQHPSNWTGTSDDVWRVTIASISAKTQGLPSACLVCHLHLHPQSKLAQLIIADQSYWNLLSPHSRPHEVCLEKIEHFRCRNNYLAQDESGQESVENSNSA